VATNETESRQKSISSEMRLHDCDDALPGNQEDNPYFSSLVSSGDNTPDHVAAPLVSVIVAAYNVEKYLSQCLDSLVNQTLTNIEIIVVNDASTDNSLAVMKEYQARYPTLRVIDSKKNLGQGSARNIGLRSAKGQYIAFTDADDWADIRMCEVMYRRASDDAADVLIANATVYDEGSKSFAQHFDQPIRQTLDPRLRTMPFELHSEPRILLLEVVPWLKLYKRSFLQKHALHFEEGRKIYEDNCFHFSVLMKATRISLLDDALYFYRQNRPGQTTAQTSRKVFDVFAGFEKIHENLVAWDAAADIWAMLVKTQLRVFEWLLRDRVQAHHKREFLASVARQFQKIPADGFRNFAWQANPDELSKLFCMRRNWLYAYEQVVRHRGLLYQWLYSSLHGRWRGAPKRAWGILHRGVLFLIRSLVNKTSHVEGVENTLRTINDRLNQLTSIQELTLQSREPLVETCRINNHILFLSRPAHSGLGDAIGRMQNDYYLTQTAVFREGDTVIDVGAHVGVVSIYLYGQEVPLHKDLCHRTRPTALCLSEAEY
jgi:glycosyltransferase involved in cell wall biosynthesis